MSSKGEIVMVAEASPLMPMSSVDSMGGSSSGGFSDSEERDNKSGSKKQSLIKYLLIFVFIVVMTLAAAGQRAFSNNDPIEVSTSASDDTKASNSTNEQSSEDVVPPKNQDKQSSDSPKGSKKLVGCMVSYTNKNMNGRNLRVLQTSKGFPGRHYAPVPCTVTKIKTGRSNNAAAQLKVDFSSVVNADREEAILGFGGAFTEASALNFHSLSEQGQEVALDLLFGTDGLGYSMGRVHMNSCDFCTESYSFDDVDGDFQLNNFDHQVSHDVNSGMIDFIQRAKAKLQSTWGSVSSTEHMLNLVVSPWSPPAWMKLPISAEHTGYQHLAMDHAKTMLGSAWPTCLKEGVGIGSRYADAWALYFSKFINAYKDHDIDIWAVTVQNEPEFPAPWEACVYTPDIESDFIAFHLGPKLSSDHPDVKLFIFDHNKDHGPTWMSTLLNSSNPASKFIKGTGIHWYAGGMDRLLDGAVGTPNMHKMVASNSQRKEQIILGTEACHCPSTYYAGGDIDIGWARAERYAHTVLADLAAGSNGWIEWNLILDSVGGPNHLGNVCDAPLIAVPHRATGAVNIPSTLSFEKVGHPFGQVQGDFQAPFVLDYKYGIPQDYLAFGIAVQPMYFYMGHISRYVRPGARPVHAIAGASNTKEGRVFWGADDNIAGGGINNLARIGIEITMWPCEGSTRQLWKFNKLGQLQVFGEDWLGNPTTSCTSTKTDQYFGGLTLVNCDSDGGFYKMHRINSNYVQVILQNSLADPSLSCLTINELANNGGALGPLGGAQVVVGNCNHKSASLWRFSESTGELMSDYFTEILPPTAEEVCMTTGWPFLQIGAFAPGDKDGDHTIVVLNEADRGANIDVNVVLVNGEKMHVQSSIPAHGIQTLLL